MGDTEFPRAPQGWLPADSLQEAIKIAEGKGITKYYVVFSLEPATGRSGWRAMNELDSPHIDNLAKISPEAEEEVNLRRAMQRLSAEEVRKEFGV